MSSGKATSQRRLDRRSDGGSEAGFTLIEMLVALAIFSLAALALLRLGGATATNSASLSDQAIAQMVARNLAVETLSDPQPPVFGTSRGDAANGGRRWRWTRTVSRSPPSVRRTVSRRVWFSTSAGSAGPFGGLRGGCGAAAQAAALLGMVARYSTGEKYDEHRETIERIIVETDGLRATAIRLAEEDEAA